MKKSLTILLTLWDRSQYSLNWLENNNHPDYEYFIADGSRGDENFNIFKNEINKNLNYKRYPYDNSFERYLEKILDAIENIKTPYVMISDNDDFINQNGINACLTYLNKNSNIDFISGNIHFVSESKKKFIFLDQFYNFKDLDNDNFNNNLWSMINPYKYVWYSIYRVDLFKKIWHQIKKSKNRNFYTMEIFQSQLSLLLGKFKYLNTCHYIRRTNPITRVKEEEISNEFDFIKTWIKNNGYLNKIYSVDDKILREILAHYLLHYKKLNIKYETEKKYDKYSFQKRLQKIYFFFKKFEINEIRNLINDNYKDTFKS